MQHQSFRFESLGDPFRPARIAACADIEAPPVLPSRRAPWLRTRFGFVGSAEGFDLLRFEAPTVALTPRIAPALLAAGRIDALVVECAEDDLTGDWGLSFFDWAGAENPARALMRQAAEARIPRIALLRGDAGQADLFAPLAAEADHAVVTCAAARDALTRRDIAADLVRPVVQPALYHGFVALKDDGPGLPQVLSLDLAYAIDDPAIAALLHSLAPFGLVLCSADRVVRRHRVEALPETLAESAIGSVTPDQLRHLFGHAGLLVQIARPDRDPGPDIQHALHAAASRCAVVILGEIAGDDPRRGFAQVFSDIRKLRLFISRFTMDPLAEQLHMQAGWRRVHRDHAADDLARHLARYADPEAAGSARPRATVLTPSFRPDRLQQALTTFRAQTWQDRELIVVANTDHPEEWDQSLLRPEEGERIVFLPRRFGPGTALNIGAGRGSGDYLLRMDDDDRYGPHYIEDMMLGAAALRPDMMGKPPCFYYYVDEERLLYLPPALKNPALYPSEEIGNGGLLAGFSHTVRRTLMLQTGGYPDRQHGGVDAGFLDTLMDRGDLLCARGDALSAVIERRADPRSHTWQTATGSDNVRFRALGMSLTDFLKGVELPGDPA